MKNRDWELPGAKTCREGNLTSAVTLGKCFSSEWEKASWLRISHKHSRHHLWIKALAASLSADTVTEIFVNPGLYLAVILDYRPDLRPVFSPLSVAALASWRGRAAAGAPPTWATPPPAGRSSETQRPLMRRRSARPPEPGTDHRDFSQVGPHLIWNRHLSSSVSSSSSFWLWLRKKDIWTQPQCV